MIMQIAWHICLFNSKLPSLGLFAMYSKDSASYPSDNCNSSGTANDPQQLLSEIYINHNSVQSQSTAYVNSTNIAQQLGKPFIMFETNTASCGGFSGLSDSFAAAMWTIDYGLYLAYSNFSYALFHVGGQSDFYNVSLQ